jgi:hypothetical protein
VPEAQPRPHAKFNFWPRHAPHVSIWYPNPSGLFADTNPLVKPFN